MSLSPRRRYCLSITWPTKQSGCQAASAASSAGSNLDDGGPALNHTVPGRSGRGRRQSTAGPAPALGQCAPAGARERFPEVFAEVFRDPSGTTFLCFLFFVLEAA